MTADLLSNLIDLLDVREARMTGLSAGGDWALAFSPGQFLKFNAVIDGECWLRLQGNDPIYLRAGQGFLLTSPPPFTIASNLALPPRDGNALFTRRPGDFLSLGGDSTRLLGCAFDVRPSAGQMLREAVPALIVVDARSANDDRVWQALLRLYDELRHQRIGYQDVARGLAGIVLVDILRTHLEAGGNVSGSLAGLRDQRIERALNAMHTTIERRWTVKELAQLAAMSRSSFAKRFSELIGQAPLEYLHSRRMDLARIALATDDVTISEIGRRLGYASDGSFSNAFKAANGLSPRQWRRVGDRAAGDGDAAG